MVDSLKWENFLNVGTQISDKISKISYKTIAVACAELVPDEAHGIPFLRL